MARHGGSVWTVEPLESRLMMTGSSIAGPNRLLSLSAEYIDERAAAFVAQFGLQTPLLKLGQPSVTTRQPAIAMPTAAIDDVFEALDASLETDAAKKKEPRLEKGLTIVGLSRDLPDTVTKLAGVLTEAGAPKHIGFSFAPTFAGDKEPYANALQLTKALLDAGKSVTITPFLGFHGKGASLDEAAMKAKDIAERVKEFVKFAKEKAGPDQTPLYLNPHVHLVLSVSLEDNYKSHNEFVTNAKAIASYIPDEILQQVKFQRTPSPATSDASGAVDVNQGKVKLTGKPARGEDPVTRSVTLLHEIHSLPNDSRVSQNDSTSIDGFFIRADIDSDKNGIVDENEDTANATENGDDSKFGSLDYKPTLTTYLQNVKSGGAVDYLWRPWMNLFDRQVAAIDDIAKDVAGYKKSGNLSDRVDVGQFDDLEANVLRKFLGIPLQKGAAIPDGPPQTAKAVVPVLPEVTTPTITPTVAPAPTPIVPAVPPVNLPPVATQFVRQTETGKSTNINLSKYYDDPERDAVSIVRIKQPEHGRVERDPDHVGRLIYVSDAKYRGPDEFQVLVEDTHGGKTLLTISLNVTRP